MARRENLRARSFRELVKMRREIGLDRDVRRRRIPRQQHPTSLEREYARVMLRIVREVRASLQPLFDELSALVSGARAELRVDAGESRRVQRAIAEAARQLDARISPRSLEDIAARFAARVSEFNRAQLRKQIRAAIGADVLGTDAGIAASVDGWVVENVALIKTIPQQLFSDVEGVVTRGLTSGTNVRDLTSQIGKRFLVSRNRARVIARDQIGKLNGQINARRQQNIGVESFVWRTVNDERVRDEHADLEGRSFLYREGGHTTEGIPGEPIQCRCHAEPDFTLLLEDEE